MLTFDLYGWREQADFLCGYDDRMFLAVIGVGVMSHGLSCEVCKYKVHKRCASKAINNCKWTTLASVGKEIIEDKDGVCTFISSNHLIDCVKNMLTLFILT
jgi:hypothetical protein